MSDDRSSHRRPLPLSGVTARTDPRFRRADGAAIRRRRARTGIWRVTRWLLPVLLVAAVLAAGAKGLVASGLLRVREIVVTGTERLSAGDVRTLVAGLEHEQVFGVNLDLYRRRLLDSPWVADVRLTRVLPATVRIDVVERRPIAAARHGQQLYLVDKTGSIIGDYGPADREHNLPVVDGLIVNDRSGGPVVVADRARLVDDLFVALAARPELLARVSEVDVSNARDVTVLFSGDTAWLHLGNRAFVERAERYLEARVALVERFGRLDYVDLRFDERLFVRGLDRDRIKPVSTPSR